MQLSQNKPAHDLGYGIRIQRARSNFFATHGINVTTNSFWFSQQGTRVGLFNEESTGIPNHYMYKLTDSLALASAMEKLDPRMTIGGANAFFEAGSAQFDASLEGLLDGLRRLLFGAAAAGTPVGDTDNSAASRLAFHANLKALADSSAFQSIAGKVRIDPSSRDLGARARNDFAAFPASSR